MLESEIYNSSSPIWKDDFTSSGVGGANDMITAPSPAGSSAAMSPSSILGPASVGPASVGPASVGPASVGRGKR